MAMVAVDSLLRKADEHYNAGHLEPAALLCGDILVAHPDHIPTLHLAAAIAFSANRVTEGTDLLGRLFDLDPDHVPALIMLADALAVKGDRDSAVAVFQRAINLRPRDVGLHAKLGACP